MDETDTFGKFLIIMFNLRYDTFQCFRLNAVSISVIVLISHSRLGKYNIMLMKILMDYEGLHGSIQLDQFQNH